MNHRPYINVGKDEEEGERVQVMRAVMMISINRVCGKCVEYCEIDVCEAESTQDSDQV